MDCRVLKCGHCGAENCVAICKECSRAFVITSSHVRGQLREYEAEPICDCPEREVEVCDFCAANAAKAPLNKVVAY